MEGTVFSKQLQKLRRAKGDTQEQLAQYLSVSAQAVSKWENGSYPDGDLLPRIADYFNVSIDYLYGRDKQDVPLLQQIMERIQELSMQENFSHEGRFEEMFRIVWAMQAAFWNENHAYYERNKVDGKDTVVSTVTDESGVTYMRLNRDLEYYALMKEPEGGFQKYFKVTEDLTELFSWLSDQECLKILFYLLSLKTAECVSASTIAQRFEFELEKTERFLDFFAKFSEKGNGMVFTAKLLNKEDELEKVYTIQQPSAIAVLLLLAGADAVIHPPQSFFLQMGFRSNEGLFRRETPRKDATK